MPSETACHYDSNHLRYDGQCSDKHSDKNHCIATSLYLSSDNKPYRILRSDCLPVPQHFPVPDTSLLRSCSATANTVAASNQYLRQHNLLLRFFRPVPSKSTIPCRYHLFHGRGTCRTEQPPAIRQLKSVRSTSSCTCPESSLQTAPQSAQTVQDNEHNNSNTVSRTAGMRNKREYNTRTSHTAPSFPAFPVQTSSGTRQ